MLDLVAGENSGKSRGVNNALPVSSLPNFRQIRAASESTSVARMKNVLLYSESYELDDGACKELFKSGGALVFSFSDILRESGFRRAIVISKMRMALAQCRKSGCGFVVCTLAKDASEARNAHELESFKSILGMNRHEQEFCDRTLARLAGVKNNAKAKGSK
ncbi:MAG: hypothetical protein WCT52_00370 [Candidatus Micrarchaeia archaeon]